MITREELLTSPEYWFEHAQNELYRQVVEYKESKGINQTQLAEELGVSKGYVSQILKGEFNYTLKTLIDISLAVGVVPKIEYTSIDKVIAEDSKTSFFQLTDQPMYAKFLINSSGESKVAEQAGSYNVSYKAA